MTLAKTQSFIDRSIAKNAEVIDALRQGKDALADCPFCVIRSADGELMGACQCIFVIPAESS